jgi:hypothetical protein
LLFGGVLALGNIQQPKLFRSPFDATSISSGLPCRATTPSSTRRASAPASGHEHSVGTA